MGSLTCNLPEKCPTAIINHKLIVQIQRRRNHPTLSFSERNRAMEISDNPGGVASSPLSIAKVRRVSVFEQINLNVFWIANNFHWQALLAIVIPSMVAKLLDPTQKDINLALVVIWGTLVAVIVNPLVGAISDYVTFRMGRRRPFMIIGTVLNVI